MVISRSFLLLLVLHLTLQEECEVLVEQFAHEVLVSWFLENVQVVIQFVQKLDESRGVLKLGSVRKHVDCCVVPVTVFTLLALPAVAIVVQAGVLGVILVAVQADKHLEVAAALVSAQVREGI